MTASSAAVPTVSTRVRAWWSTLPIVTKSACVVVFALHVLQAATGFPAALSVCLSPKFVTERLQLWRLVSAPLFHGGLLHVATNLLVFALATAPLEKARGSVKIAYLFSTLILGVGVMHVVIAFVLSHAGLHLVHECSVGLSGVIFALLVVEAHASAARTRSIFGLFEVPTKLFPWVLLILAQLLMPNASLLGHLAGVLVGEGIARGPAGSCLELSTGTTRRLEGQRALARFVAHPNFHSTGLPTTAPPQTNASSATQSTSAGAQTWGAWAATTNARAAPFTGRAYTIGSPTPPPRDAINSPGSAGAPAGLRIASSTPYAGTVVSLPPRGEAREGSKSQSAGPDVGAEAGTSAASQLPATQLPALHVLTEMGFAPGPAAVALEATHGDLEGAVTLLTGVRDERVHADAA